MGEIAGRIDLIRLQKGFTQQQLAAELHISQSAMSKYMKERIPAPDVLLRLAQLGNTTIEWILTGRKSYFYEENTPSVREHSAGYHDADRALARDIAALPSEIRKALMVLIRSFLSL